MGEYYKSGIYKITCKPTNKVYIGQSIDVEDRIYRQHKPALRSNRHENSHLQNAFNKYGEENFTFEIICRCPIDKLDELEIDYILLYNSLDKSKGFNFTSGGSSGYYTPELSLDKRLIMSESKNKSGYYGVYKKQKSNLQQGFIWEYQYRKNKKVNVISSVNLLKLEEKVKSKGLEWIIIDKKLAKQSQKENNINICNYYLPKYNSMHLYKSAKISRFANIDSDELLEKVKNGKTPKELAKEYNTSNNTILYNLNKVVSDEEYSNYLYQCKLKITEGSKNPNYNNKYNDDLILKYAKEGLSSNKIVEKISTDSFKASKATVLRRLRKLMTKEEYKDYCHIVRSKAHSGKNHGMYGRSRKGKNNPFYGRKHSLESRKKISESHKNKRK